MVTPTAPANATDKNQSAASKAGTNPSSVTQPAVPFAKLLARLAAPAPAPERMGAMPLAPRPRLGEAAARDRRDRTEASAREDAERADGESSRQTKHRDAKSDDDALSSWSRHCADLAPPQLSPTTLALRAEESDGSPAARAHSSLEELLPGMVRRVAWSGDGKRGAVRMELGSGELAGGVLLVEADGPSVRVKLDAPAGVATGAWEQTIRARLEARGLSVESVEVS